MELLKSSFDLSIVHLDTKRTDYFCVDNLLTNILVNRLLF